MNWIPILVHCYCCQSKLEHSKLSTEEIRRQHILLCNKCRTHFIRSGYLPKPTLKPCKSITLCTSCHKTELETTLYHRKDKRFSRVVLCRTCIEGERDAMLNKKDQITIPKRTSSPIQFHQAKRKGLLQSLKSYFKNKIAVKKGEIIPLHQKH